MVLNQFTLNLATKNEILFSPRDTPFYKTTWQVIQFSLTDWFYDCFVCKKRRGLLVIYDSGEILTIYISK